MAMPIRKLTVDRYPLEIVLRTAGHAELLDANECTIWASNADPDFKDQVSQDFLTEEDIDDILDYLAEAEILNDYEISQFESGAWDVIEESVGEGDEDENEDEEDAREDDDIDEE